MSAGREGLPGVVVIGARGRMGRFAAELLRSSAEFTLAAELDVEHDLERALERCPAELGLDFTVAGRGFLHGQALLEAGIRPVIGTSGVTREETARLDRRARELDLGGLVVPNFSLGLAALQRAAVELARHFARVEIVELHHERKQDAPSSTARATAEALAASRAEPPASIPIHSVRLPGLFAHQEVLLGAPGELVTLRHDMLGPEAFGPGILLALRHALRARGVAHGLDAALEPKSGAAEPLHARSS
jgi:4-hydroxy-tetrahydrodipicolinate reductase